MMKVLMKYECWLTFRGILIENARTYRSYIRRTKYDIGLICFLKNKNSCDFLFVLFVFFIWFRFGFLTILPCSRHFLYFIVRNKALVISRRLFNIFEIFVKCVWKLYVQYNCSTLPKTPIYIKYFFKNITCIISHFQLVWYIFFLVTSRVCVYEWRVFIKCDHLFALSNELK